MKQKSNAGVAVGKGFKASQPRANGKENSNAKGPGYPSKEYPTPACQKK